MVRTQTRLTRKPNTWTVSSLRRRLLVTQFSQLVMSGVAKASRRQATGDVTFSRAQLEKVLPTEAFGVSQTLGATPEHFDPPLPGVDAVLIRDIDRHFDDVGTTSPLRHVCSKIEGDLQAGYGGNHVRELDLWMVAKWVNTKRGPTLVDLTVTFRPKDEREARVHFNYVQLHPPK